MRNLLDIKTPAQAQAAAQKAETFRSFSQSIEAPFRSAQLKPVAAN